MLSAASIAFRSFYQRAAYNDVVRDWKGMAVSYLAILSLICSICWTLKWWLLLGSIAHSTSEISHQVPGISCKNGRVLMKSELPLVITSSWFRKRPLLVIDTTTGMNESDYNAPLVVREQDIRVYGFSDKEVTTVPKVTVPLKDLLSKTNFEIDPTEVSRVVTISAIVISILLFVGSFWFFFGFCALQSLIWGGAFLGISSVGFKGQTKLPYQAYVRVAALALTPSIAIRSIMSLFGLDFPWLIDIVIVGIYFAYLYFAFKAICPSPTGEAPEATVAVL